MMRIFVMLSAIFFASSFATVWAAPAFKKGMLTVVFEVNVTPERMITKCDVSKVQDPGKTPIAIVNKKISQKYKQAACRLIAENIHDPRIAVTDPYYTYMMMDPAKPDEVIGR